jgi:hypothetical protein
MRHMKRVRRANATDWTALLARAAWTGQAGAQGIAVAVGNTVPVTNVLGRTLVGNNGDPDNSCPVEIRRTGMGGQILAPTNDPAQLEAFNPLITNTYLGRGVVGANPGIYAETFTNRSVLATNQQYYVRVFNRPNPQEAVYYADTPPFFGPPEDVPSINPEFGPLVRTDGEADVDTDGDGIPDALEDETDTIPSEWDSDHDGFNDWFEAFYAPHMDPAVSNDVDFAVLLNPPGDAETEPYTVSWWTLPVPGMTYLLEYTDGLPFEEAFTVVLETNVATDAYLEVPVDDLIGTNDPVKGFFRVTVPYAGP